MHQKFPVRRVVWTSIFLAALCTGSSALATDRTIAQFAHTTWGPKDGAPSAVTVLAQSADGYLWLGSPDGLYRFDGVAFERYQPRSGGPFPAHITSLLALPNGDLWISFLSGGISVLRNGYATNYTVHEGVPVGRVLSMAQDREGTLWVATDGGLARLEGNRWKEIGKDWDFPGRSAHSLFLDNQGTLWVSTEDTVVFLPSGARRFHPTSVRVGQVLHIAQAENGKIWMAETTRSVRPLPLSDKRLPPDDTEVKVGSQSIVFDEDGALWIATLGDGLRRSPSPELLKGRVGEFSTAVESFTVKDGLSDDNVRTILRDREGNIWVGTNSGLDRFRKTNLVPLVPPFKSRHAILVAGDAGDAWIKYQDSIFRVHGERADPSHPIPCTPTAAYRDPAGAIWWLCETDIYRYHAGNYTRVGVPSSFPKIYAGSAMAATQDGSGALWLATQRQGLFYRKKGRWQRLETASEFEKLIPQAAFTDWMGRAWFGYREGTIILLKDGNIQKVFLPGDSPVGSVDAIGGRGHHILVGGEFGLAFFDGNRFRRINPADLATFDSVRGVEETSDGSLWLAEHRGVIQVSASEVQQAFDNPSYRVKYRVFDSIDGLPGTFAAALTNPKVSQGTDGRLWFGASGGIAWIDPAKISANSFPPAVLIRSVRSSGRQVDSVDNLVLPPRTTDLQISYTSTSLSVPERIRFRYRLEGVDKDWQDAGTRREAFYTMLGPGKYHFRVIAGNSDGVWNEAGASLDFFVEPAWFQTNWFRAACVGAFLALMWGLYQLRLHQLRRQFNVRLEARVNERTRIARELHDTLLQSLHGLMFEFQAARNMFHKRPEEALQALDSAITGTEEAISESQDAIENLRNNTTPEVDLAQQVKKVGEELVASRHSDHDSPTFGLTVEGQPRALTPFIRDEAFRIAREALRNAFRHAQAHRIEAEILYGEDELRIRVRDDGNGMAPEVLEEGRRPGHWGLPGARERAQQIGAKLDVWSEAGAGTEVQLAVAASVAYQKSPPGSRFRPSLRNGNHERRP